MIDMGVEPFLVASTVEAVMAQRLIRRLCEHCKEPFHPKRDDMPADFPWDRLADRPLYRSIGCRESRQVGYRGRMGIYELLLTTEAVRQLAHDRKSTWDIKKVALAEGMRTLRDDGWDKAMAGATSIDEVLRITKTDRM
jgi:general secretion pathway protein E/type IV pilus assembly protein PilB